MQLIKHKLFPNKTQLDNNIHQSQYTLIREKSNVLKRLFIHI